MKTTYRAGAIGRTGKGDYGHGLDVAFQIPPDTIEGSSDGAVCFYRRLGPGGASGGWRTDRGREALP